MLHELMRSIIAASVVDLPLPVGPVTSTRPRGFIASCSHTLGSPSCAKVGITIGIARMTIETAPRCFMTFTRKRATPGTEYDVSMSPQ